MSPSPSKYKSDARLYTEQPFFSNQASKCGLSPRRSLLRKLLEINLLPRARPAFAVKTMSGNPGRGSMRWTSRLSPLDRNSYSTRHRSRASARSALQGRFPCGGKPEKPCSSAGNTGGDGLRAAWKCAVRGKHPRTAGVDFLCPHSSCTIRGPDSPTIAP